MYALDGSQPPEEVQDPLLRDYRGSAPVRWGNGAIHQQQHDVYGEIIDIAYQWSSSGAHVDARLWTALVPIVELAITRWRTPDSGPWEIRSTGRPFTYSAALCYVAVDRAIQIARKHGLPYPNGRWEVAAREIREAAPTQSWNPELQTFTEHLGGTGGLDAALLTLPVRNVIACCAVSGRWTTSPARAGSTRLTRCTRGSAAARIRWACCRNKSTRRPASSWGIFRRPLATSASWPADCACSKPDGGPPQESDAAPGLPVGRTPGLPANDEVIEAKPDD